MLFSQLQTDLSTSLKGGKADRVETIRFLIAAIANAGAAKYGAAWESEIKDTDVTDAVKKQIKTHRESIEAFEKAGRKDLADKEIIQLAIFEEFAPKELSDEELKKLLTPIAASGEQNFGLLMKTAMAAVKGQADGGRVSAMLKQLMQ